jgi:glucosamine kinase
MSEFWIGVDGGGTGTRVLISRAHGTVIGRGQAGPSALGQGIDAAWSQILRAIQQAFATAGLDFSPVQCAIGAGLSGVHNPVWRDAFVSSNPGFGVLVLESDATTMLLGAHGGQPGVMVAAGTGSVGEALHPDGSRSSAGGWGFPVGDEGSGAWMGLHAVRLAQAALDGRQQASALTQAVLQRCGASRDALQDWCAQAGQFAYASLAPLVFASEGQDPLADALIFGASQELEGMVHALDAEQTLPVAFCGSIGELLKLRVSHTLQQRMVEPRSGAVEGALELLKKDKGNTP